MPNHAEETGGPDTLGGGRSIASLPMVEPGTVSGVAKEVPVPKGVSRSQLALFGVLCLAAGLGGGYILSSRGESAPAAKPANRTPSNSQGTLAKNDKVEKKTVPTPVIVPPAPDDAGVLSDAGPDAVDVQEAVRTPDAGALAGSGTCALVFQVTPDDASILVGGAPANVSAGAVDVPCEETTVTIEHEKYANYETTVMPTAGEPFAVEHVMKREMVMLEVRSVPNKAWISIDGKGAGKTPKRKKVPAHEPVTVKVSKKGFKVETQEITPTEDGAVTVKLKRFGKAKKKKKPTSSHWQL